MAVIYLYIMPESKYIIIKSKISVIFLLLTSPLMLRDEQHFGMTSYATCGPFW